MPLMYDAKVYNVLIASPSDVEKERRIVRDVIQEWNATYAEAERIILMPVGWETHSSPAMDDRPQAILNRQILERADLLVAIFWTRLGTPTGEEKSGTVEEIRKHREAGKPAMIYFSLEPVRLDSGNPEQYEALKQFRAECEREGLIERYEMLAEFRDKFRRQLALTVIEQFGVAAVAPSEDEVTPQEPAIPSLSDPAKELLLEASEDRTGHIMMLRSFDGVILQTNRKNLVDSQDPRSVARWEEALDQLVRADLVEERGTKGEVFKMTAAGYRVADQLREQGGTARRGKAL